MHGWGWLRHFSGCVVHEGIAAAPWPNPHSSLLLLLHICSNLGSFLHFWGKILPHLSVTSPNLNSFSIRSYQKHKPRCFNYWVVRSLGCRFLFLVHLAVAAFPDGKMTLQSTAHICLHEFLLLCLWLNIHYELISIFYWYVSHRLFLALAAYQHVDSPTGRPFNLSAVFRANI